MLCSFHIYQTDSYLAAIPPCRRLDTLGLPSLSIPPDTVSPRVVPSFFISSTMVEPLNSSVKRKAFASLNESRTTEVVPGEATSNQSLPMFTLCMTKSCGLLPSTVFRRSQKGHADKAQHVFREELLKQVPPGLHSFWLTMSSLHCLYRSDNYTFFSPAVFKWLSLVSLVVTPKETTGSCKHLEFRIRIQVHTF